MVESSEDIFLKKKLYMQIYFIPNRRTRHFLVDVEAQISIFLFNCSPIENDLIYSPFNHPN